MKLLAPLLLAASLLMSGTVQAQANDPRIPLAEEAATAWLVSFDAGNVQESWERSAALLRQTVPVAEFGQRVADAQALGPVQSRRLGGAGIDRAPAQAPERGDYVVLQYLTQYAKRPNVFEKIISMRDSDGIWRVVNYLMLTPH